jgi:phosphopantothenoylcysteine decarboxylase / phosphopantothenate---cysteine ligase
MIVHLVIIHPLFCLLSMKKVIIGVSGSIAAYKVAHLVRLFIKNGTEVRVLMTPAATEFISPVTLGTLSKNLVITDVISETGWNNHVELGLWADAYVIAPATANTLSKLANGICDNILSAVYLSARCPVWVAPAMDLDMWHHPATQRNIATLKNDGVRIIPVGVGELASGLSGEGRLAEPEEIFAYLKGNHTQEVAKSRMIGKKVVITAGPTHENLDPVRFIGNRSTGKMGIAIAEAMADAGAEVQLVLGPTHLPCHKAGVHVQRVQTAQEMYEATLQYHHGADIVVFSAAVADYRPQQVATEKIKKKGAEMHLDLVKTIDIAATLGQKKRSGQLHIGFALETEHEMEHAESKLAKKNFDFVVLNSLRDEGAGFGHDTNKVTIINKSGVVADFPLLSKVEVAFKLVQLISNQLGAL